MFIVYLINMKLYSMLVLVTFIVLISGCTLSGGGDLEGSKEGIVINSLSFSPTRLEGKEEGILALEIQNVGSITAKNVTAHIYGIDTTNSWDVISDQGDLDYYYGEVDASDKLNNIPSFPITATWSFTPLFLPPKGVSIEYTPSVRVCYIYNTTATAKFRIISKEELKQEKRRGTLTYTDVSTKSSGGPVSIAITSRQPLIVNSMKTAKTLAVNVKVINNDLTTGLIYLPTVDCMKLGSKEFNRLNVTVNIPSIGEKHEGEILLGNGKIGSKTFIFSKIPNDVIKQDVDIIITTTYGYSVDASTRFMQVEDSL